MANISLTLNLQFMMSLELFRNSNSVTLNKKYFVLKRRITIPHKQECRGGKRISGSFKARKFRILFYKNNRSSHFLTQNKYTYTVQNLLHFHISSHTMHIPTVSRSTPVPTLLYCTQSFLWLYWIVYVQEKPSACRPIYESKLY
jgi:hypothetical protein